MIAIALNIKSPTTNLDLPKIIWEKQPEDFILPDDPVDNNLQRLLAAVLRESLELADLALEAV